MRLGLDVTPLHLGPDVTHVRLGLDFTPMCLTLEDTQVEDHPGLQLDLEDRGGDAGAGSPCTLRRTSVLTLLQALEVQQGEGQALLIV